MANLKLIIMKNSTQLILALFLAATFMGCQFIDDLADFGQAREIKDATEITEVVTPGSPCILSSGNYDPMSNYGYVPQIITNGNSDNSFEVAWWDMASRTINITVFDAKGNHVKDIRPAFIGTTGKLLGFTRITKDGNYVVGYSKDNSFGDKDFEYWIARFDASGKMIFNTRIFGDRPSTEMNSKGAPGTASSARIVYNEKTGCICFYTGHTMKYSDNVRHQGGYIGFLDLNGKQLMQCPVNILGNSWFFSHNFDQRLMVIDGVYYALAHGDAYPRALGFSSWTDNKSSARNPLINTTYFSIPGTKGENITNTQTGGFVGLPDGNIGIVFASSVDRTKRDICFLKVDKAGNILASKWLTQNTSSHAVNPRIACRGNRILVAWEDYNKPVTQTNYAELDINGQVIGEKTILENVVLQPLSDWITLPNGDIIWAVSRKLNQLSVFRIKA